MPIIKFPLVIQVLALLLPYVPGSLFLGFGGVPSPFPFQSVSTLSEFANGSMRGDLENDLPLHILYLSFVPCSPPPFGLALLLLSLSRPLMRSKAAGRGVSGSPAAAVFVFEPGFFLVVGFPTPLGLTGGWLCCTSYSSLKKCTASAMILFCDVSFL